MASSNKNPGNIDAKPSFEPSLNYEMSRNSAESLETKYNSQIIDKTYELTSNKLEKFLEDYELDIEESIKVPESVKANVTWKDNIEYFDTRGQLKIELEREYKNHDVLGLIEKIPGLTGENSYFQSMFSRKEYDTTVLEDQKFEKWKEITKTLEE